jgi:hypothetical protein
MLLLTKRERRRFRVFLRKIFKKISGNFEDKTYKGLDEIQIRTIFNVRQMITKKDATLLIAPISSICYIEWSHYFIRFGDSAVTITNGKYSYYIWLPSSHIDKLKDIFYRNVEVRRKQMEEKYNKRTLDNLNLISEDLKNDKSGDI